MLVVNVMFVAYRAINNPMRATLSHQIEMALIPYAVSIYLRDTSTAGHQRSTVNIF